MTNHIPASLRASAPFLIMAAVACSPDRDESGGMGPTPESSGGDNGSDSGEGDPDDEARLDVSDPDGDGGPGDEDTGCAKIDFLFVVDNSSSMVNKQENLIAAFPQFISKIQSEVQGQDYHIMVVDSDADPTFSCEPSVHDGDEAWETWCPDSYPECTGACPTWEPSCGGYACGSAEAALDDDDRTLGCGVVRPYGGNASNTDCDIEGGRRYLTGDQANLADAFGCVAKVGTSGHWYEAPISAMRAALSPDFNGAGGCNEGFLRDDAVLVVVFMSDDDDAAEGPDEVMYGTGGTPQEWHHDVITAKSGVAESVVMLGIITTGNPTNMDCEDYGGGYKAPKFVEFIERFAEHGLMADSCDADYTASFDEAVALIDQACDDFIPPG